MPAATESREPKGRVSPISDWQPDTDNRLLADPRPFSLARVLLIATLLAAPLAFGAVLPWAWAALGLVAGLGLFLWALGCVQQGALRLVWSPVYLPLALFLLLGVVQYAFGLTLEWSETRLALILLAEDLVFFFLAGQLFAGVDNESLRAFGHTALIFGGFLGLFAILQFISGTHRIYGIVDTPGLLPFGPYVNRDHFAGLMEMLIPVAILYIAGRRMGGSLGASVVRVFAVVLAVAALLLSGSRGGLLALLAEIGVAAIALRRTVARTKEGRRLLLAAALVLLPGVLLFIYVDPGEVAQRLSSIAYVNKTWAGWTGDRKCMTLDTLRLWRDHPLLGVGLGDFEIAYPRYQTVPKDEWIEHAHNDYVEALAETGLAGALLIAWAMALFFRAALRGWGQAFQSHSEWVRLGAAIGCCGMLLHSLWDFNLHIPANAAWFAVLAGLGTPAHVSAETQERRYP